jgi:hypothetical protein
VASPRGIFSARHNITQGEARQLAVDRRPDTADLCPAAPILLFDAGAHAYTLAIVVYSPSHCHPGIMQCGSCSCTCCDHPHNGSQRNFIPYHRAPTPPLPANTLILPSSASAFDAPPHQSTRKRAFSHVTNITSAELLEALYWKEEGEEDDDGFSTEREREEGDGQQEVRAVQTGEAKGRQASSSPSFTLTLPPESSSSVQAGRMSRPLSPRPVSPRPAISRPLSPRPLSPSQQTTTSQVLTISRPAVSSSASSAAHHLQPPASARSTSSRSPVPDSDTAVFHGRRSPTPNSQAAGQVNDSMQDAAAASLEKRKREAELHWERDKARREVLRAAFEASQQRRLQRVSADDRFYADMLRRQWERRVMMQHFEARAQQERQRRRTELTGTAAASVEAADDKPAFADYGASSAQRQQDGQRLRTFNISPDVSSRPHTPRLSRADALLVLTCLPLPSPLSDVSKSSS